MIDSYVPHRFNPQVAQLYGIPAALVFQFISYCCDKHKLAFLPVTVSDLAQRYPYLDRRTVGRALEALVFPGKDNPNPALLVRKKLKGVWHYHPVAPDEKFALHVFDANVAVKHGILPAIILQNIGHWVRQNWKRKAEQALTKLKPGDYDHDHDRMYEDALVLTANAAAHTISIEEWLERHPYTSYRTAVRGFSCLQQAGLISMRRGKHSKPIWVLSLDLRAEYAKKLLKLSTLENPDANLRSPDANLTNPDANLTTEQGLNSSAPVRCGAFDEGIIDEDSITEYGNGFASPLAGARGVARSALNGATASPAVRAQLHRLNRPSYDHAFKRPRKETRQYTRHPKPGDEDFDLFLDDLTPDQRRKYLARVG